MYVWCFALNWWILSFTITFLSHCSIQSGLHHFNIVFCFCNPWRTRNAMGGSVTFKKALSERLSIIRCSREQVNKLITDHPPQLTAGIK
jgi:hypothetical protein